MISRAQTMSYRKIIDTRYVPVQCCTRFLCALWVTVVSRWPSITIRHPSYVIRQPSVIPSSTFRRGQSVPESRSELAVIRASTV